MKRLWLIGLVLLISACNNYNIKPEDHPAARSAVFGDSPASSFTAASASRPTPAIDEAPRTTPQAGVTDKRPRHALVIGNSRYGSMPLKNPANDAGDIAAALKRLDFQVTLLTDSDQQEMEQAVRSFGKKLGAGSVGLFYYAGHAVQYEGENYLIPVDAMNAISAPEHLKYKSVAAGYVLGTMEQAGNGLNLVFLDACRDNPFRGFSRSLTRGLARMDSPTGSLVAYSTSPGDVAQDGAGRNSPYTKYLLQHLAEPDLPINSMLIRVNAAVKRETGGKQVPWYSSSMEQDFYFVEQK